MLLGRIRRVAAFLGRHLLSAVTRARVLALLVLLIGGRVSLLLAVLSLGLAVSMLLVLLML
jgi:hypothetical protein